MSGKNKFGFDPIEEADLTKPRKRDVGPMGAAVREAAGSLQESTENLVEQRRQNALDAREFRQAQADGRVLTTIPLDEIRADDLPRDRIDLDTVSSSDEMEELKSSIRDRGQKEPIDVYVDCNGVFQLKKGWRRLTALQQLYLETGNEKFSRIMARVTEGGGSRIDLYIDMVEENVIREDLTFAEMAQVAITAAQDEGLEDSDAEALVGRLYGSLHKMKRSYIRSFVYLLSELGDALKFPKTVSRNLGVDVVRRLKENGGASDELQAALTGCISPEDQQAILAAFLTTIPSTPSTAKKGSRQKGVKFEFHVGDLKVTTRGGECRILSGADFSTIDRLVLEKAIRAFEDALKEK